ncbi:MAG: hypothetical protein M1821_002097 [Bathelium mastoideum]|nr:MAG: hypothetical protein M1821_002097 [Bathelium mastoideum]KAI9692606.1 MAG: hypothetical protein M1822_006837 [Bathelium mastoideum]
MSSVVRGIIPLLSPHVPPPATEGSMDSSPVDTEDTQGHDDENAQAPLPNRARVDVSDSDRDSPWSRKMILSFDGGGVKGYSSLLITKRLMSLVAEIEQGLRPKKHQVDPSAVEYWEPNYSSGEYPWHRPSDTPRPSSAARVGLNEDDIASSVEATFAEENKVTAYKPHHYFDYVAGTSTGGLSAIMLGRMQMDVEKALDQYETVGNDVFGKPRPLHVQLKFADLLAPKYGPKQMEQALQKVIQAGLADEMKQHNCEEPYTKEKIPFLSNPKKCRTIVVSHGPGRNRAYESSYMFRTYDHPHPSPLSERDDIRTHKNPGPAHTHEIWKIARATSAAPRYFSNITIGDRTFRDGGMGANNPSFLALKEVRQMHAQNPRLLLSIGTGRPSDKGETPHNAGYVQDWGNVVSLLGQLATESERTHQDVHVLCKALGIAYTRQNVESALKDIKLDEWKPRVGGTETKKRMLDLTKK